MYVAVKWGESQTTVKIIIINVQDTPELEYDTMKQYREQSFLQHYMEVSCQLHAPATLPLRKHPMVDTG